MAAATARPVQPAAEAAMGWRGDCEVGRVMPLRLVRLGATRRCPRLARAPRRLGQPWALEAAEQIEAAAQMCSGIPYCVNTHGVRARAMPMVAGLLFDDCLIKYPSVRLGCQGPHGRSLVLGHSFAVCTE